MENQAEGNEIYNLFPSTDCNYEDMDKAVWPARTDYLLRKIAQKNKEIYDVSFDLRTILHFIPNDWPMPLGWKELITQIKKKEE